MRILFQFFSQTIVLIQLLMVVLHSTASPSVYTPIQKYDQEWRIYSLLEDADLVNKNIMYMDFDDQSNAWLATSVGLVHYDGYHWKRYSQDDGLPSDFVRCVKVTRNQRVLIGTDQGLVDFDGGNFRNLSSPTNIEQASIRRISEDPDGRLWFSCDRWPESSSVGGLHTLKDGVWTKYTEEDGLPNDYIINEFLSSDGTRFVLTSNGLAVFEGDKWIQPLESVPTINPSQFFWTIAEDESGIVYITTSNDLILYQDGEWDLYPFYATHQFSKITSTSDGKIITFSGGQWNQFAFHEWGGSQFFKQSSPFTVGGYGIPEQIIESPDGSIWCVGMNTLFRWTRQGSEWTEYESLPSPFILDQQDRVWFLDLNRFIIKDDQQWDEFDSAISQVQISNDNRIWGWGDRWFGYYTGNDFHRFSDEETGVFFIRNYKLDADKNIWLYGRSQTNQSLFSLYDGNSWSKIQPSFLDHAIIEFCWEDPISGIWAIVAKGTGQYKLFHMQSNSFLEFDLHPGIKPAYPPKLFVDSKQTIWLYGGSGLFSLQPYPEATWTHHTNILGTQISTVTEFHDEIWISYSGEKGGSNGISVLRNHTWLNFEASNNDIQYQVDDDSLYFGGLHCFYMVSKKTGWMPHRINLPLNGKVERFVKDKTGTLWLDVGHTTLTYLPDQIPPETIIDLPANTVSYQNNLNINIHGLERFQSTQSNHPFQFAYRINNLEWSTFLPISIHEINLQQLLPGNHTIAVKVKDEGLDVDSVSAVANFTIEPIPLQSQPWFFPALIIILIIISGLAIYSFYTRSRLKHYAANLQSSLDAVQQVNHTLQQTQKNLMREKERAEVAAKTKSHFLAKMSHEIRTPLNGIIGNLELVLMGQPKEQTDELLRQTNLSAQTLLGILGNVLDFSKIEANRIEVEHHETNIRELIGTVFDIMSGKASDKKLRLVSNVELNVPDIIVTDQIRVKQVLLNFISNALKFTNTGGVSIRTSCKVKSGYTGLLRFEVLDSGSGFNPDNKENLFQEFTQEDLSYSSIEGTGLGLAICKRIVELLHGEIGCESIPNHGSIFWFQIPIDIVQEHSQLINIEYNPQILIYQTGLTASIAGTLEILKRNEITIEQLLDKNQFDHTQHFDYVILIADSFDFVDTNFIQTVRENCNQIILITGDQEELIPYKAMKSGFDYVIQPPFDQKELLHVISKSGQLYCVKKTKVDQSNTTIKVSDSNSFLPVLIVDDTNTNRILAQNQLNQLGFKSETAKNGMTALEKTKQNRYSAILLDITMDDIDGFEFTEQFRQWESKQNWETPIIAMTAHSVENHKEQCLQSGMNDYITKPVKIESLSTVLKKWIQNTSD